MSEWSLSSNSDNSAESSPRQSGVDAESSSGEDTEIWLSRREKRLKKLKLSSFEELSSVLGGLVNDPAQGDVQFLCKDGVRVHAFRMLLSARSSVFQGMLGSGMVESKSREIPLRNISSSALLPTLEFLYSGDFHKHQPTGNVAIEVLYAAQYFLLPKLERRAYLLALSAVQTAWKKGKQDMLELFCVAATEADTSNPLSSKLLLQMVLALGNTEIPLGLLAQLSKEQLRVYVDISCTRWRRGKGFMSCLGNYHRLRLILLWCAGAVSTEAAQALAPYLPGSESKLMLLYETEGANNFHARERPEPYVPDEECGPLLQKESVKTCVSECQDLLQLHKVPLHLLAIIIEPLDIVHLRIMCDAYRRQALRGEMSVLRWDTGFWGSQYRCRARGFVLESTEGAIKRYYEDHGRGFARTSICVATDAGACAWEFVVEEWCEGIQLGFYSIELGKLDDDGETYLFFELLSSVM